MSILHTTLGTGGGGIVWVSRDGMNILVFFVGANSQDMTLLSTIATNHCFDLLFWQELELELEAVLLADEGACEDGLPSEFCCAKTRFFSSCFMMVCGYCWW